MAEELDVTKWTVNDVETYLTSKMDGFNKGDIDKIRKKIDGDAFLELTKEILVTFKIGFVSD